MVIHSIELCAGVGLLGEGARAALEFLGIEHRAVLYVEREASAAGQLATLMEAGVIDSAPVWSDLETLDGAAWRGKVDCVIAGFPCQDLSIAGRRAGLDGERSGLFFRICDIADHCGARLLILENVSAIASATATVVDEAEGELEERAAARVLGELADRGWNAEWITLSASGVGASHRRARWFCLAWRVVDTQRTERGSQCAAGGRSQQGHDGERQADGGTGITNKTLGHTRLQYQQLQQRPYGAEHPGAGGVMGNPKSLGSRQGRMPSRTRPEHPFSAGTSPDMADPSGTGRERREQRGTLPIFAPGPDSPEWAEIIDRHPYLAPATQPGVRGVVDGSPWWWTNPGVTSCAKLEMALYRSRLRSQLSFFFKDPER